MPDISLRRIGTSKKPPVLNVVFVHGLGGDPVSTWCHSGGEKDGYFWPAWLAEDKPDFAIWVAGYPGDAAAWNEGWPLETAANAVLDRLMSSGEFRKTKNIPIAFVCHSMGGLVIKKLVVNAHLGRELQPDKGQFLDRIRAVTFLATPHDGAFLATASSWVGWFVSKSAKALPKDSAELLALGQTYRDLLANNDARIRHRVYYEERGLRVTRFGIPIGVKIVERGSADPGLAGTRAIGVGRDHFEIVKPENREDSVYEGVLAFLEDEALAPLAPVTDDSSQNNRLVNALLDSKDMAERLHAIDRGRVLALAQRITADVADFDTALRELNAAIDVAVRVQQESPDSSNHGDFVDDVLKRVRAAFDQDRFDDAAAEATRGFEIWQRDEAERRDAARQDGIRMLQAGLEQDMLRRNPLSAAQRLVAIAELDHEAKDPAALFAAIRAVQDEWYERGRDKGLNFDLAVSIEIARLSFNKAQTADQRGTAGNDIGIALNSLGEREPGTARLEEAVTAFRAALEENTRERAPLDWAMTQNNLGTALGTLGQREPGTARLEEAVAAFRAALEEWTRERVPLDWAATQMNLGTALRTLGKRESGTARLEEAIRAFRAALEEWTREREPLEWAMSQMNLGVALRTLGEREPGTARLEEAVAAYRAALEEWTRERVPLDWARTQMNLGNALLTLGARDSGTARLEEAVTAYRAALEERTRERVPLNWAHTFGNQGVAFMLLAERTSDLALARTALEQLETAARVLREGGHIPWAETFERQSPKARALVQQLSGG